MLSVAEIDRFFEALGREADYPLRVIITGAVAGQLMGHVRPSDDIDFEVRLKDESAPWAQKEALESAIQRVSEKLGLPCQYTENIAGWSQISLLDYREKTRPYKTIGGIEITFLAPEHWAIGKLVRYLPLDQNDLVKVMKSQQVDPAELVSTLARALRSSPLSDRSREFKEHVVDFLKREGRKIWGKDYSSEKAIREFQEQAIP